MQYYLKTTEEMGRGLYASYEIKKNKVIFQAELLVLSPSDTVKVNDTDLKWYTFTYNDLQDCLVLGDGEIFNHSDTANVGYKIVDHAGRKVMMFFALADIATGEQLFIDYAADNVKAIPTEYKINLTG